MSGTSQPHIFIPLGKVWWLSTTKENSRCRRWRGGTQIISDASQQEAVARALATEDWENSSPQRPSQHGDQDETKRWQLRRSTERDAFNWW